MTPRHKERCAICLRWFSKSEVNSVVCIDCLRQVIESTFKPPIPPKNTTSMKLGVSE